MSPSSQKWALRQKRGVELGTLVFSTLAAVLAIAASGCAQCGRIGDMAKLLLLFTVIPIVELVVLLEVGRRIGTAATLLLILVTGVVGAVLARRQGVAALRHIRAELAAGQMPGPTIVDGVMILVAGALLITPGILTDIVGFLCLVPATRRWIRALLSRAFIRAAGSGRVTADAQFVEWREPPDQRFAGRSSTRETNAPRSRRPDGPSPEHDGSRRT